MSEPLKANAPVLLLHSSMSSARQWSAVKTALTDSVVVAVDLAGYGAQPLPQAPRPYHLLAEVQGVLMQIPELPRQTPWIVIGHSYGGAVALALAASRLLPIKAMALFEPVAFHLLRQQSEQPVIGQLWQEVEQLAVDMQALLPIKAAEHFLDYWQFPGYFAEIPAKLQQQLARQVAKVSLDFEGLANAEWTLADYRQKIACPVLLMTGGHSRSSAQAIVQLLHQQLRKSELLSLDCGHMGPMTHAELVNTHLLQFIHSHEA